VTLDQRSWESASTSERFFQKVADIVVDRREFVQRHPPGDAIHAALNRLATKESWLLPESLFDA